MATADVTVTELLNDSHCSHGLHQRLLTLCGTTDGTADGAGEAWYVAAGAGRLHAPASHDLSEGSAVWLPSGTAYEVSGDDMTVEIDLIKRSGGGASSPGFGGIDTHKPSVPKAPPGGDTGTKPAKPKKPAGGLIDI